MGNFNVKGSVALVTGSSRGIGKALVKVLLSLGAAKVYATARNTDAVRDLVNKDPERVIALKLDVTRSEDIEAVVKETQDVNFLINNAGLAAYTAFIASPDMSGAREEMEINYFALLNLTRHFAPILKKNGGGVLVNIGSVASYINFPAVGTYSASKAAVHSLNQGVRAELASQGTQVTGVYPGPVDTDMAAGLDLEKETPEKVAENIFSGVEKGEEDIFPDPFSRSFSEKLKVAYKDLEKEIGKILPQPTG